MEFYPGRRSLLSPLVNPLFDSRVAEFEYDDFLNESPTSGSIGKLNASTLGGITSVIAPEISHPGTVRRSTTTTPATVATTKLGTGTTCFIPSDTHAVLWIVRTGTNDTDTALRIGSFSNSVADPFPDGIYFEKLLNDVNWFCVARSGNVQTRVDSGVAVTTSWVRLAYVRNSDGVRFFIDNVSVGSLITTNITTAPLHFGTCIINGNVGASKSLDHDYVEMMFLGLTR